MSAAKAESLLTKAAALYKRAEMDYRDNLLSVGRLLHEFVFTSLRATDGRWRQHRPVTREGLMAEAAKKLDVRLHRVTELIIPAMTVDLLSGKGGYGNLGIRSLLRFGVLIHRPQRGTETTQASLYETWEIKPEYNESGPALFRRAVAECWSMERVEQEIEKTLGREVVRRPRVKACHEPKPALRSRADDMDEEDHLFPTMEGILGALARASPGDVANQCLKIVLANEDPWQVAQRLIVELQKIPRKKSNPLLFEREAV